MNEQDEIRPTFLITGPYQPRNLEYPYKGPKNYRRSFQFLWFESHENWLNYILVYLYYNLPPQVIIPGYTHKFEHIYIYIYIYYLHVSSVRTNLP